MEACGSGTNYVCVMIYMLIVSYFFPGKIDYFTSYINHRHGYQPQIMKNNEDL